MSPEIKEFSAFAVQGLQVRTTNAAEQTAEGEDWGTLGAVLQLAGG